MSISNPALDHPCKKFIEYSADDGTFFWYNKETEKKVQIETPIYFVVLDELSVITGFSKKYKCGIFSNEIHKLTEEILRVRTFKAGELIIGKYQDIRDNIIAIGGKFTKSVYALMILNEEMETELVNFKFKGAAFSAWLDKKFRVDKSIVGVSEFVEEVNGKNTYMVPVFKPYKMNPAILEQALEVDKILQEYLKAYKAQQPEVEINKAEAANPLLEELPDKQGKWQGKEPKLERAKGKQETKSMTDPKELGDYPEEIPPENQDYDNLPF
jgi:hypothetical protein